MFSLCSSNGRASALYFPIGKSKTAEGNGFDTHRRHITFFRKISYVLVYSIYTGKYAFGVNFHPRPFLSASYNIVVPASGNAVEY